MGVAIHIRPDPLRVPTSISKLIATVPIRPLLFEVKLWGRGGDNGAIAQESKTATRKGWLSQHWLLSSALDESGTVQLPSHFRLQTIDRSSAYLITENSVIINVPEVTAMPGVPAVASVPAFK